MNKILCISLGWLVALCANFAEAESPRSDALQVEIQGNSFVLSVPVSKLVMIIPKGQLKDSKGSWQQLNGPRYFYFVDRGTNLSGWFEPEHAFKGQESFWKDETEAWRKKGLPSPVDVVFKKINHWDAIFYDLSIKDGVANSHIRANWVQSGTWIDIHLSTIGTKPSSELRASLESLLKSIQVKER